MLRVLLKPWQLFHAVPVSQAGRWQDWLTDMLATAEQNMFNQVLDPQEFSQESPWEMLNWPRAGGNNSRGLAAEKCSLGTGDIGNN
jgi:hypothetical protein